ncbi:MAG: response regulator [bacterium]
MPEQGNVRNKILYADDDEKSRILVRKILESEGFVVSEAADGLEAVQKASSEMPDLILMDILMPVIDGFDALDRIREAPGLADVPAIAITARGMEREKERERIIKSGYHGYISKPIQRVVLIEEVERILNPDVSFTPHDEDKILLRDEELAGRKVLLVDDNPVHLQLGTKVLANAGMDVIKAVDGQDAMKVLESDNKVDIILSDILMPGMDGYQLCRMIKTSGPLLNIPFVFYTSTYADNKDIRFGLDLGAERYIIRPIPAKRLLEIIKEVLRECKERGGAVPGVPHDVLMVDEVKYYREYNERLVSKLEHKLLELENAYRALEMRNQELNSFNQSLEEKVKERTMELEQANRYLIEMDRKKTEFLNIVAHDLRTPLTSIRSYADLLIKYKDEPESVREEFLNIIYSESVRLGNLINDYLDLTRIESGLYPFRNEPVDLNLRIEQTVNNLRSRAQAKEVSIETALDPELKKVMGDEGRLDQVLANLFSNALKFCSKGGKIEIRSCLVYPGRKPAFPSSKAPPVEQETAAVMIRDSGPGIQESDQERIFEKFTQVDSPQVRASGGTGLGLSIVKEIVDRHKGKTWVESREGEGSAFFILLPVDQDKP